LPGYIDGGSSYYFVIKIDNNTFKLADSLRNAILGTVKSITSDGTGTHSVTLYGSYIIVSDNASPANANTVCKIIKIGMDSLVAGQIDIHTFLSWDTINLIAKGLWNGRTLSTLDDADFAYDFRGGDEQMIIQTRIGVTWYTFVLDEFIGDSNLLEGTDKTGVTQGAMSAGDDVTVQMGSGEGPNFTAGKFYYLYDFIAATSQLVQYVKVTKVGTGDGLPTDDHIQLERVDRSYATGSVIAAYAHRFYCISSSSFYGLAEFSYGRCSLPYGSLYDVYEANHSQSGSLQMDFNSQTMYDYLAKMAPNDLGVYAVQKPGISESNQPNNFQSGAGMNRSYGIMKNIYACMVLTMAKGQDGRVIGGNNYLYFRTESELVESGSGYLAYLFQDYETTS